MDEWMDRCMIDGWMVEGLVDGWMVDEWMVDECMVDGWMDRWMVDVCIYVFFFVSGHKKHFVCISMCMTCPIAALFL